MSYKYEIDDINLEMELDNSDNPYDKWFVFSDNIDVSFTYSFIYLLSYSEREIREGVKY